jgi:REP element-mobilizing transposase RayT
VNPVEPKSNETEQGQRERSEPQADLQLEIPTPLVKKSEPEVVPSGAVAGQSGDAEIQERPFPAEVSYSCLLIPRFPDHHLAGDITEDLVGWMKEICISYGWRLDGIILRPGYLQWVLTVPLAENPVRVMRFVRQHTSQKIFEDYPRFKRQNLSGDFWAPGYYIVPGDQLITLENISSFIQTTRKQQGIF